MLLPQTTSRRYCVLSFTSFLFSTCLLDLHLKLPRRPRSQSTCTHQLSWFVFLVWIDAPEKAFDSLQTLDNIGILPSSDPVARSREGPATIRKYENLHLTSLLRLSSVDAAPAAPEKALGSTSTRDSPFPLVHFPGPQSSASEKTPLAIIIIDQSLPARVPHLPVRFIFILPIRYALPVGYITRVLLAFRQGELTNCPACSRRGERQYFMCQLIMEEARSGLCSSLFYAGGHDK